VLLSGVDSDMFTNNKKSFPFLQSMTACDTQAPGSKSRIFPPINVFLNCPVPKHIKKEEKKKKNKKQKKREAEAGPPGPSHYLLSHDELADNNFPLATQLDKSIDIGWVTLSPPTTSSKSVQLIAIDCEMVTKYVIMLIYKKCSTSNGLELTRISIVDEQCSVLYDSYVLPSSPILDYHTKFSGITADLLIDCKVMLKDVQLKLQEILHADMILVGHSLENDLIALKLLHTKVIDTSILYPNQRGGNYKNALKYLAQRFLNTTIQANCHDSIVDASTAMQLTQLKIQKGPKFGGLNEEDTESLFKILESSNNKCAMVDTTPVLKQYATTTTSAIPVSSDKEALEKLLPLSVNPNFHFVWCQFHQLEDMYNSSSTSIPQETVVDVIKQYDTYMSAIYQHLQKNTLLLSITGSGNINSIKDLTTKKLKSPNEWTAKDETELEAKVDIIRKGITFFALKQ
jgi:RNA exonuclease 1